MKNKFKTFIYGLLIVLYGCCVGLSGYAAVNVFIMALNDSGIMTILEFLLSVWFAFLAVFGTYKATENLKIKN